MRYGARMKHSKCQVAASLLIAVVALACGEDAREPLDVTDAETAASAEDAASRDASPAIGSTPSEAGAPVRAPSSAVDDAGRAGALDANAAGDRDGDASDRGQTASDGGRVDSDAARARLDAGSFDAGSFDATSSRDAASSAPFDGSAPADSSVSVDAQTGANDAQTVTEVDAHVETSDGGSQTDAQTPPERCGRIYCDCTLDGVPLTGRVKFVTSFGDFKVREDTSFPDLNVRETNFPSACGEWQVVTIGEDFTVELVPAFEDFSFRYSSFPGIP
jgi:hypothetical protein